MALTAYVINLAHRKDRRAEMQREFARIGWNAEFFPAVQPPDAEGFPSIGARGCFESHLAVLKKAASAGAERVVVMEDDLNFSRAFSEQWSAAMHALDAQDWSIFYPAHILEDSPRGLARLPPSTGVRCTHFMMFNGAAIQHVIAGLETILARPPGHPMGGPMHVDGAYSTIRAQNKHLTTFAHFPSLGYQRPSRTDIGSPRWFDRTPAIAPILQIARKFKGGALRARDRLRHSRRASTQRETTCDSKHSREADAMNSAIPVDIVMGTYNGAEFLQEQIDSLLEQTHPHWRLLVRDDGSSDGTLSLLAAAAERDCRIHVVRDAHGNLGFNRNFLHVLALSDAPYVMFADQDDVWLPRKIELTLADMLTAEAGNPTVPVLVHCDAIVTDANLTPLRNRFIGSRGRQPGLSGMLFTSCVQGAASMMNTSLRERVLHVPPLLPYDIHSGLIAAVVGKRRFVDQALLLYRQHARNAIGAGTNERDSQTLGRVSPTLQLAINASTSIVQTLENLRAEWSSRTLNEIEDFKEVLSGRNRLRRLLIALRRRYAFYRRRDRLNLLLYICNIKNI